MKQWVLPVSAGMALLGALAFILLGGSEEEAVAVEGEAVAAAWQEQPAATQEAEGVDPEDLPISFPHDVHARDFEIDCQYCHFSADRSASAGIPPVSTCMGCHNVIAGDAQADEIDELRQRYQREEPIPWARVYKLADHVTFPHMRHISAGVDCAQCHGQVENIGLIQEVAQPLTMGWCLNCHIEEGASRDCWVCHF